MNVSAFIADDEAIARAGLRDMLAAIDWVECVGEAANGITAVIHFHGLPVKKLRRSWSAQWLLSLE